VEVSVLWKVFFKKALPIGKENYSLAIRVSINLSDCTFLFVLPKACLMVAGIEPRTFRLQGEHYRIGRRDAGYAESN